MRIVVCVKQVPDPDVVNALALAGRLDVDGVGSSFGDEVPLVVNAYDAQAVEVALRLRDAGLEFSLTALCLGTSRAAQALKYCIAMGCDEAILIEDDCDLGGDGTAIGRLLAAVIAEVGPVDLVLCGRQASDDDQGVVPSVIAEVLRFPIVLTASDVQLVGSRIQVVRATTRGSETVRSTLPAVVTVSNEVGVPRYPTSRGMLKARKQPLQERKASSVPVQRGGTKLLRMFMPQVSGHCLIVEGETLGVKVTRLIDLLRARGAL